MVEIKIFETKHKAKVTLRALKTYKDISGKDITEMDNIDDMHTFIYACIDAAYRFDKKDCPVTIDDVLDYVSLQDASRIVSELIPAQEGGK